MITTKFRGQLSKSQQVVPQFLSTQTDKRRNVATFYSSMTNEMGWKLHILIVFLDYWVKIYGNQANLGSNFNVTPPPSP